jgi:hypothetical protein
MTRANGPCEQRVKIYPKPVDGESGIEAHDNHEKWVTLSGGISTSLTHFSESGLAGSLTAIKWEPSAKTAAHAWLRLAPVARSKSE